jgi:hypothetical protein
MYFKKNIQICLYWSIHLVVSCYAADPVQPLPHLIDPPVLAVDSTSGTIAGKRRMQEAVAPSSNSTAATSKAGSSGLSRSLKQYDEALSLARPRPVCKIGCFCKEGYTCKVSAPCRVTCIPTKTSKYRWSQRVSNSDSSY